MSDRLLPAIWRKRLLRVTGRTAALMTIWVIAAEGDLGAIAAGLPVAIAGATLSVALSPGTFSSISLPGAARFVRFFAIQSVLGGIDVALRALRPSLPLDPAIVRYPLRLREEWPRVLFVNTISMLPGTLSSRLEDAAVEVHVLDCSRPVVSELAAVEERIADLFGATLPPLLAGDAE